MLILPQINYVGSYSESVLSFKRNALKNANFYVDSVKYPSFDYNFCDDTEVNRPNLLGWNSLYDNSDLFLDEVSFCLFFLFLVLSLSLSLSL